MRSIVVAICLATSFLLSGCPVAVVTGVGAGVMAAEDRRTLGTMTDDESIEIKTVGQVSEKHGDRLHLNVTSFNRVVLLTGEAPDEKVRQGAERIARSIQNVRHVVNELTVGPPTSLSARANDSYITSKIKARFVDGQRFNSLHVKVVTEKQVAYLLGLVKHQEAKDAAELARNVEGVKKVVTVFEYLD
jgi:osmotically-inducible protein OsmY